MKRLYVTFLFFLGLILFLFNTSCRDYQTQHKTPSENLTDSLVTIYETIRQNKELDGNQKLSLNGLGIELARDHNDSMELKLLAQRSGLYRSEQMLDSAIYTSGVLRDRAIAIKDSNFLANAYYRLGFYNRAASNFKASLANYYLAKELDIALKDSLNAGIKLLNLSNLLNLLGNYNEAEIAAVEGLSFIEELDQPRYISGLYNALAISSNEQKLYQDALHWYNKALDLKPKGIDSVNIANNIAQVYLNQGKYQEALDGFKQLLTLEILKEDTNQQTLARVMDNQGYAKFKLGISGAEQDMLQALQIRIAIGYKKGQFISYLHLLEYYKNTDPQKSMTYAKQAYGTAIFINNPDSILTILGYLIELSENPKPYSLEYKQINDSITRFRQRAKNEYAKIRHESEQNIKKAFQLTQESNQKSIQLQKSRNRNIQLLAIIILMIITTVFTYRFIKAKHLRKQLEESYKAETRLSKKIHDELANDIYNVMAYTEVHSIKNPKEKEALLSSLDKIYSKTRNISRGHASINTGAAFSANLKEMLSAFSSESTNILLKGIDDIPWENIEALKKTTCFRVLQELMVNMKKHSGASLVLVSFSLEDKKVFVHYIDNGSGVLLEDISHRSGLQNTENRMAGISGAITFESYPKKGFKCNFSFPV
jgi:signal transduction histidine kinase